MCVCVCVVQYMCLRCSIDLVSICANKEIYIKFPLQAIKCHYTACSYLDHLIKLRKKCVRAITFSNYLAPSRPIVKNLNILKFEKLVVQRISLMMFKFNMSEVPKPTCISD